MVAALCQADPHVVAEGVSVEELKALRDDAAAAREEEAASLLLELAVQQQLRARPTVAGRPDPRSPYVAHLRTDENGVTRDYFLGTGTFVDTRADVRVVDWRVAPVAQLFYRYREGDPFDETLNGREASGTVKLRRVVVVHQGQLMQVLGEGVKVARAPDGTWHRQGALSFTPGSEGRLGLGVGIQERGTRADVTALLDAQQFAAVSAPAEEGLLVLGSAGSGKTTVALHRLARIVVADPEAVPLPRTKVVVPEEGLARLARRLLKPLVAGLGPDVRPPVETLDEAALRLGRHALGKLPPFADETPALATNLKRHPATFAALKERFTKTPAKRGTLPMLRRMLANALSDRGFLARIIERAQGTLPSTAIEDVVRHTMLQAAELPQVDLDDIEDDERKTPLDGRGLGEGTPDELAGTIDFEDIPILLSMMAWRGELQLPKAMHLVLDEAEDFSLFDLEALRASLARNVGVTLAGDEAQQTHSSFAGWSATLEALGAKKAHTVRLETSYRCPKPIAELARQVLGHLAPQRPLVAMRDGAPVGRFTFPSEAQSFLFLADALRDLVELEPHASIGVVTHDAETAKRFFGVLGEVPGSRLVLQGEFNFEPGIDVTDVDSVKGLEFDYVVVPDCNAAFWPSSDDGRRRLHVAVTRATHQLWLIASGKLTPLVDPVI